VIVQQLTVGPIAENCYLLADAEHGVAVLVDPGAEADRLLAAVDAIGCTLSAIWLTHAHFDHVGAVAEVLRSRPVPVYLHPADREWYDSASQAAQRFGLSVETPPPPDHALAEGDTLRLGALQFDVWHLPGHAPGHVAFIGHGLCVSGDVLFEGSVGRTDLPRCDPAALRRSLQRLTTLPPETRVLPGHGGYTDIGTELATNPFLSPQPTY
jgi:glyoxylase-like metal-dependent hydrolase (beta-lactamase superfamily II)